ncbi:MAG: hypothetical protein KF784_10175 [Fimbriimonadaceae bacterium]|nr:hypothetical protein [Fimbriimonadaceae bacterium]
MSDEEIRRLYGEATKSLDDAYKALADSRIKRLRIWWTLLTLIAALFFVQTEAKGIAFLCILMFAFLGPYLWEMSERKIRKINRQRELRSLDVRNPRVLRVVVDHVKSQPLFTSEEIKARVAEKRKLVNEAAIRTSESISRLDKRLDEQADETMRLLMLSKRAKALETLQGLQKADALLEARLQEADEIVRPVIELAAQFELMWDISRDIDVIREAGELVKNVHEEADDRLTELTLLNFTASKAIDRLASLQSSLDSENKARIEFESWLDQPDAAMIADPEIVKMTAIDQAPDKD